MGKLLTGAGLFLLGMAVMLATEGNIWVRVAIATVFGLFASHYIASGVLGMLKDKSELTVEEAKEGFNKILNDHDNRDDESQKMLAVGVLAVQKLVAKARREGRGLAQRYPELKGMNIEEMVKRIPFKADMMVLLFMNEELNKEEQ